MFSVTSLHGIQPWKSGLAALAMLMAAVLSAQAASCGAAGQSGTAQNLSRQIAAIKISAQKRGCSGSDAGGFFSACRDIGKRLADAQRQLAAVAPVTTCGDSAVSRMPRTRRGGDGGTWVRSGGKLDTMCVRLSDGYYFPSPNSGYGTAKDAPLIAAQCKMICGTEDMDVFQVNGSERLSEAMTSLTTGRPYADLPRAGAYRAAAPANRCDVARYYRRAAEMIASTKTPAQSTADIDVAASAIDTTVKTSGLGETLFRGSLGVPKKVRIVGPSFFPVE